MANETIAAGGTLTLSSALTGGTNIDFLNTPFVGGDLIIEPAAFLTQTIVNAGSTVVAGTLGGSLLNFQSGDQINLLSLDSVYATFDVAANAASENAQFDNDMKFSAESGDQYFIENDGTVTASVNSPITTVDANTQQIFDELATAMFGTAAAFETVTLAPYLVVGGGTSVTDALITVGPTVNPCFVAGTRILTVLGEVPVEALRISDLLINAAGEEKPVVWIGRLVVDVAGHPTPDAVRPVLLAPDALGEGVPARTLRVSPDHAFYLDGVLVPARDLINGTTIRSQAGLREVVYYHVELPAHDIIFAEGCATESYLDTGHRGVFDNSTAPVLQDQALMQGRREKEGCAPLCTGGARLEAIRERLARRHVRRQDVEVRPLQFMGGCGDALDTSHD
jgi:hypothetical protein